MRLVTLDSREVGGRPGIALPSGEILDLAAAPSGLTAAQWRPHSVVSVLAEGEEGAARVARLVEEHDRASESQRQEWRQSGRLLPGQGTRLMPPIRRPGLLLMVTDAGGQVSYVKNPNSAAGPDASIAMPAGADQPLYMLAMVGIVLGRPLFRGTPVQAERAIAALTLVGDLGTAPGKPGASQDWAASRQFPGASVIGPALLTVDELRAPAAAQVQLRVNGRPVGAGSSMPDIRRAAALVAELSSRYAFRPGDVVGITAGIPEFELPAASRVSMTLGSLLQLDFATAG
ncbi:MAG: fumarylacetoacetate hydrolase family protein [Gammaproteobacteria bacterium]